MICSLCNTSLKPAAVYCNKCGNKVGESVVDRVEGNLDELGVTLDESFISLGQFTSQDYIELFYFEKGVEKMEEEEYYEAIEYFQRAIHYYPDFPNAHNNIAYCYVRLERHELSIEWIRRTLKLKSDDIWLLSYLANAYCKTKKFKKALAVTTRLIELEPEEDGYVNNKKRIEKILLRNSSL